LVFNVFSDICKSNLAKLSFKQELRICLLKSPIHLKANDNVTINFWRLKSAKQVWYEWCVAKPVLSKICNPNGRTYSMSLY
jgi:hypothetical protein